jgi:hypothetical protein
MTEVIENVIAETVAEVTGTVADKRKYGTAVKRLVAQAGVSGAAHVKAAEAKRDLFTAMMDVRITITHEGRPDFGGNSGIWKSQVSDLLVEPFTAAGLNTVELRRTYMNSVSQNGLRALIMEGYIVKWLLANNSAKEGTPAFTKAVRAEYTAAKRSIPKNSTFFPTGDEAVPTGGPAPADPKVRPAAEVLEEAITIVHTQEAAYDLVVMLNAIARLQTEAATYMRGCLKGRKNNIPNRPMVRMLISDSNAQTAAMLAMAESKSNEETYKTLALVAWTPTSE